MLLDGSKESKHRRVVSDVEAQPTQVSKRHIPSCSSNVIHSPKLSCCCRPAQLWPARVILCLPSSICRQELGCSPLGSWLPSTWHAWHCWSAWLAHCHLWKSCKRRPALQVSLQTFLHLGRRVAERLSLTQHLRIAHCTVTRQSGQHARLLLRGVFIGLQGVPGTKRHHSLQLLGQSPFAGD